MLRRLAVFDVGGERGGMRWKQEAYRRVPAKTTTLQDPHFHYMFHVLFHVILQLISLYVSVYLPIWTHMSPYLYGSFPK